MAKRKINTCTNENNEVKSLFNGQELTGKPLTEYNRPMKVGVKDSKEYVKELRSARQLTDEDYSIRINA